MTPDALFRASEMLDMAIQIEQQGLEFYKACLDAQTDSNLKAVFQYLADQEKEHAGTFSRMKGELPDDYTLPESYPGEIQNYIDTFVKGRVFDDPAEAEKKGREMTSPSAVIDFGLDIEKASILFYSGMKEYVRASERQEIDRIIAEEQKHVKKLLALRKRTI